MGSSNRCFGSADPSRCLLCLSLAFVRSSGPLAYRTPDYSRVGSCFYRAAGSVCRERRGTFANIVTLRIAADHRLSYGDNAGDVSAGF